MDQAAIVQLVDAHASQQDIIEQRAIDRVMASLRAVESVEGWYAPASVAAIASQVGAISRSASKAAAALTDAYLARVLTEMTGRPVAAVGALALTTPLRRGVASYADVYNRLPTAFRVSHARGAAPEEALTVAMTRADAMIRTDLQLARRQQEQRVLSRDTRVIGYRRVIHPELSRTGTCGLCIAAADRRYRKDELRPLHDRCKCDALPITADNDPGGTLNDEDLAAVYASADSTSARDLKEVRVRVEDHGELGPRLVNAGQRSVNPGVRRNAREAAGLRPVRRADTRESSQAYLAVTRTT